MWLTLSRPTESEIGTGRPTSSACLRIQLARPSERATSLKPSRRLSSLNFAGLACVVVTIDWRGRWTVSSLIELGGEANVKIEDDRNMDEGWALASGETQMEERVARRSQGKYVCRRMQSDSKDVGVLAGETEL